MGAWGELAFDNDTANDWAYGLDEVDDLSLVESALVALEDVGDEYLDQDIACNALAACEVLARLIGNFGYRNAYTEKVDSWVRTTRKAVAADGRASLLLETSVLSPVVEYHGLGRCHRQRLAFLGCGRS